MNRNKIQRFEFNFLKIDQTTPAEWENFGAEGSVSDTPFASSVYNFYMTDPVSRASETMAHCIESLGKCDERFAGTDG